MARRARWISMVGLGALMVAATACGSDSDQADAESAFCDSAASLSADVSALADIDVLTSGLDGFTEQFDTIRADVEALQESGLDVAADEIDALQAALAALEESVTSLSGSPSLDAAGTVLTQVGDVATAAGAVIEVYTSTCD